MLIRHDYLDFNNSSIVISVQIAREALSFGGFQIKIATIAKR